MKAAVLIFAILCLMIVGLVTMLVIWIEMCTAKMDALEKRIEVLEWQQKKERS